MSTKPTRQVVKAPPPSTNGSANSSILAELARVAPQSLEAEQSTLGTALLSSTAADRVLARLTPEAFYRDSHRSIFHAIRGLREQGKAADVITVAEELRAQGALQEGGEGYLRELVESVYTVEHAEYYAEIVADKWRRREIIDKATALSGVAHDESPEAWGEISGYLEQLRACHFGTRERFVAYSTNQLAGLPKPKWLIRDLFEEGSLVMIFGLSNCGKTFVTIDWGNCLAHGKDWQGHDTVLGQVVYVIAEGRGKFYDRLSAWMTAYGVEDIKNVEWLPQVVDLYDSDEASAFTHWLKSRPKRPIVVFIDTFARCEGEANENDTGDMNRIVRHLDRIQKEVGCCIVLNHHTNKTGEYERGNAALRNACNTVIRCEQKENMITLTCEKQREAEYFPPITLIRKTVDIGGDETSCYLASSDALTQRLTLNDLQGRIMDYLSSAFALGAVVTSSQLLTDLEFKSRATLRDQLLPLRDVHEFIRVEAPVNARGEEIKNRAQVVSLSEKGKEWLDKRQRSLSPDYTEISGEAALSSVVTGSPGHETTLEVSPQVQSALERAGVVQRSPAYSDPPAALSGVVCLREGTHQTTQDDSAANDTDEDPFVGDDDEGPSNAYGAGR